MGRTLKTVIILFVMLIALYLMYKAAFVRTVNYEIAGIKIPSKYNVLTGTVKPIDDYKGKTNLKTVGTEKANMLGLSEEQVVIAKLRWAVFTEWVNSHREYKGWRENPEIFKKANEDFKRLVRYGTSKK